MKNRMKHCENAQCNDNACKCSKDNVLEKELDSVEKDFLEEDTTVKTDEDKVEISQLDKAQEYLEMAQRVKADFDNYRRRTNDFARQAKQEGTIEAVEKLLPVIDSINGAKRQVANKEFLNSINLIYNQTLECFENLGVKKIDALNTPFDPNLHNAIMVEKKEGEEADRVIDVFQEGFILNDKVIRHSVVKVSK